MRDSFDTSETCPWNPQAPEDMPVTPAGWEADLHSPILEVEPDLAVFRRGPVTVIVDATEHSVAVMSVLPDKQKPTAEEWGVAQWHTSPDPDGTAIYYRHPLWYPGGGGLAN